jgi:hypothetical protein
MPVSTESRHRYVSFCDRHSSQGIVWPRALGEGPRTAALIEIQSMGLSMRTNQSASGSPEAEESARPLMHVPLILHERLGNWARQLRPRLQNLPIRWFETRSRADLEHVLPGLAYPVVLIDPGKVVANGLVDLDLVLMRSPGALVLVNNAESDIEVTCLARELGATHVLSGFVPPPEVASLLTRWILLALRQSERAGWSRTSLPEPNLIEDLF